MGWLKETLEWGALIGGIAGAIFLAGTWVYAADITEELRVDDCIIQVHEDRRWFSYNGPVETTTTKMCIVEESVEKH